MAPENEKGEEILDKTPVALPVGYEVPEPLEKMVARMVRAASAHSASMGNETLEEANDFGPDEEEDEVKTMYQYQTMEEEYLDEKPRTSSEGDSVVATNNESEPDSDSAKVQKFRSSDREEQPRNRRAEDKDRTEQRRERRKAADSKADN